MLQTFQYDDLTIGQLTRLPRVSCFYFIDHMLIDTGPPNRVKTVIPFYEQLDIDFVVLTHSHEDHCGAAPWLANEKGIPVYAHEKAIDICAEPASYKSYRRHAYGLRDEGFAVRPLPKFFETEKYTWDVIETPGHAPDQVAFYNREKGWLFSGDIYVTPKTRLILSWEHIRDTMESLERVLAYDFDDMFCGHAGHVKNGKRKIQAKLDDLKEKKAEILYLYEKGYSSEEITKKLFPNYYPHPLTQVSEGEWNAKYLVETMIDGYAKSTLSKVQGKS